MTEEVRIKIDSEIKPEKKHSDPFAKSWDSIKHLKGTSPAYKRKVTRSFNKVDATEPQGTDAQSKQIIPGTVYYNGYGAFDVITPPYDFFELAQYYETSFANHAAVDTKVSNIVGLGYHWELTPKAISRIDSKQTEAQLDAARRKIERAKVQLSDWLDNLNDTDTFIGTLEKVVTDVESLGNGYLEIGRKTTGEIGYIGHIPAITMRVRRLKDGYCQIVGEKVVFFSNYQDTGHNPMTTDPQPNEIIHIKKYSPLNTYYGVPDVLAAGQAVVGDILASAYNIDYFGNKAVPRYVVTLKGAKLSQDSEEKLFAFLQSGLKGQNHRTLYIPLPPDDDLSKVEFKMEAIENGVQEASFTKYHENNRNDVLAAHQVPLSKIGLGDGSLAGTIATDRTFKEQVARPAQRQFQKIISKIIAEVTDVLEFRLNELTLTDELAQSQINEKYLRNQVVTPNEVRDALGKPPRPGGDEVIELTPRQAADAKNEAQGSDQRAQDREDNAADSPNTIAGRNPENNDQKA